MHELYNRLQLKLVPGLDELFGTDPYKNVARSVLELHTPQTSRHKRVRDRYVYCNECVYEESSTGVVYPCDTVKAIARELGVSND